MEERPMQATRGWIILGGATLLASCAPAYYAAPPAPVYYPLEPVGIYYPAQHASIGHPEWYAPLPTNREQAHTSKSQHPRHPPVDHAKIARRDESRAGADTPSHWIDPEP
jgi:hypothetical protein